MPRVRWVRRRVSGMTPNARAWPVIESSRGCGCGCALCPVPQCRRLGGCTHETSHVSISIIPTPPPPYLCLLLASGVKLRRQQWCTPGHQTPFSRSRPLDRLWRVHIWKGALSNQRAVGGFHLSASFASAGGWERPINYQPPQNHALGFLAWYGFGRSDQKD